MHYQQNVSEFFFKEYFCKICKNMIEKIYIVELQNCLCRIAELSYEIILTKGMN